MAYCRGSALPITINVQGVDLTEATEITFALAWQAGQSPIIPVKTKSDGDITVAYDAGTEASTLTLVLSAADTATFTRTVHYALYIDDGSTGGEWIPDDGGYGSIPFTNVVQKS